MQRASDVHALVLQQLGQVQRVGRHGAVVAGAIKNQIQRPALQQLLRSAGRGLGVGHVQRQRLAAGVLAHECVQQALLARRHAHLRPACVQQRGHGTPNAGGRAHQPYTLAAPVGDGGVQRHGLIPC